MLAALFFMLERDEKKAVEDLSLTLASGDFVTIIGGNGLKFGSFFHRGKGV